MPDYINKLLDRTMGLSEVVQPLVNPIFSNGIPNSNDLITIGSQIGEKQELKKGEESKDHIENQSSTFRIEHQLTNLKSTTINSVKESNPYADEVKNQTAFKKSGDAKINNRVKADISKQVKETKKEEFVPKSEMAIVKNELHTDTNVKKVIPNLIPVNEIPNLSNNFNLDNNKSAEIDRLSEKQSESTLLKRTLPNNENSYDRYPLIPFDHKKNFHAGEPQNIKVTIGRIDVHAVMQPTQSYYRSKTPFKPKLSLDDYLKQRDGER